MAKTILRDVVIEVDGVELSDRASRVVVNSSKDPQDTTTFGAEYRESELGLGDASIEVTFYQDFDANKTDQTLWPLHESGDKFPVFVKATSGPLSATNPGWRMDLANIPSYTPLNGGVGDASTVDVTFQNAGQTGVVRVIA